MSHRSHQPADCQLRTSILPVTAADLALAASPASGKKRRSVEDNADAAAAIRSTARCHGGEVLPGGFVGTLGKAPDQLFEDQTHVMIGYWLGAEIGIGKLPHHLSSTHSRRRNRVKGRIMRPYWLCLKSPREGSATDQIKAAVWEKLMVIKKFPLYRI